MTELSLYEQRNPLTTISGQWFFDMFQGDDVDTDRWTEGVTGSPTTGMADSINGGYFITSPTSSDEGTLSFNNSARHYSNDSSVFLSYTKINNITSQRHDQGFVENIALSASYAYLSGDTAVDATNWEISTDDGATASALDSVAMDTDFHLHRLDLGASNVLHSMDGILHGTKTTNLPDAKQQPRFFHKARSASSRTFTTRYVECINV